MGQETQRAEVYLDWNATTPMHPAVAAAMAEASETDWANPSSVHASGRRARARVENTREAIAQFFGFHPRDVVFTSGGTEANNLALSGVTGLVTSAMEHPSVTRVAEALSARGVPVMWAPVRPNGQVEVEAVRDALGQLPEGAVVSVMAVNHETGVIQPMDAVAQCARDAGAWLHSDTVQAVGKVSSEIWRGADSVTLAPHKFRGPKGVGALCFKPCPPPKPVVLGGSQERGIRPGTLDAARLEGFRVALSQVVLGVDAFESAVLPLRDRFERALVALGAEVNGAQSPRAPHVCNLFLPHTRGDELVVALDLQGIHVSSGSACSAGTPEGSSTVAVMHGRERALSSVRVSLGAETCESDVDRAVAAFTALLG